MGYLPGSRKQQSLVGPNLNLPLSTAPQNSPAPNDATALNSASRLTIWQNRISLAILVVFCITLGMLLIVLPWMTVWTENRFLSSYPELWALLRNQFTRGAISGLGLVDIWIGISETVHYTDPVK